MIVRKAFNSLLVLWFAALSACPPVTLTHAHAAADDHRGHSDHGHGHRHFDCEPPVCQSEALAETTHWHVHLWFLGVEVHLRLDDQPQSSSDADCIGQVLLLREGVASCCRDLIREMDFGPDRTPINCTAVKSEPELSGTLAQPPANPPLCDRARRERSGVLLA